MTASRTTGSSSALAHAILWSRATPDLKALRTAIEGETTLGAGRTSTGPGSAPWLAPVRTPGGTVAILSVPDGLGPHDLYLNGARQHAGAHLVEHGDRIDLGETSYWFASSAEPQRDWYKPERDGDHRFCGRTKARLVPGEAVVACPGKPQQSCSELFREVAWSDELPCHSCGFRANAPEFEPPARPSAPATTRLLDYARGRGSLPETRDA